MITLFFMGTMQHREGEADLITQFFRWAKRLEQYIRLFDGVGSQPKSADSPHPMPGTYTYDAASDQKILVYHSHLQRLHTAIQSITGSVAGDGVEDLLLEAMQYIEHCLSQDPNIKTINLIGFSRGADTAVRLSNILNVLYPDFVVNIFCVDQVPGPGNRDDRASYTLSPNVKEFTAILMLDETTPCFSPQHRARYVLNGIECVVRFRLYHGVHGQAMKRYHYPIPMYLAHDELLRFAWRHQIASVDHIPLEHFLGPAYPVRDKAMEDHDQSTIMIQPVFDDPIDGEITILTKEEKLSLYHSMIINKKEYSEGLRANLRSFTKQRHEYVDDPSFFLDNCHRQLFRQVYPALFSWLFKRGQADNSLEQNASDLKWLREDAVDELSSLQQNDADGYQHLINSHKLKKVKPEKVYRLPDQPMGKASRERDEDKPVVHDELSYLHQNLYGMAYYHLKHRSGKVNAFVSAVIEYLLKSVRDSRLSEYEDEEKILRLDCAVVNARKYLQRHSPQHFMLTQLRQVSPNYEKLATRVKNFLHTLLVKFKAIGQATLDYLKQTIERINEIIKDTLSTAWDKFSHLRQTIQSVSQHLLTQSSESIVSTTNGNELLAVAKLSVEVDRFILHSGDDIITLAIRKLHHYIHKRSILLQLNRLSTHLGVTSYNQHLFDKLLIAQSTLTQLHLMKKMHQGDDREAILQLLSKSRLKNLKKHTDATFLNCDLDILLTKLEAWAAILKPASFIDDVFSESSEAHKSTKVSEIDEETNEDMNDSNYLSLSH